jgi:glycosyltransferase involved in cell wall biosynthesis
MIKKDTSVLILTHNAPDYVRETLETLNEVTRSEDRKRMEIIVFDNASEQETKLVLLDLYKKRYIDTLEFSSENLMFAGGNNACARLASKETKYYLLLNSDVHIVNKNWFNRLRSAKEKGSYAISAYGCLSNPNRVDGYCLLIDRDLYDRYELDESFQWWWGVTKLEALLLKEGFNILGFYNHNNMIIHYGGKSGTDWTKAKGMDVEIASVKNWYEQSEGKVVFELSPGNNKSVHFIRLTFKKLLKSIRTQ